jgi:hypothetical protein
MLQTKKYQKLDIFFKNVVFRGAFYSWNPLEFSKFHARLMGVLPLGPQKVLAVFPGGQEHHAGGQIPLADS